MSEPLPHEDPEKHDPYLALRFRNYRAFAIGWMIFVVGHQALMVALAWEIYDRTGSVFLLGLIAAVQVGPLFLFALPAGQLADTHDRRRIVQITGLVSALASVALAMLSYREGLIWAMFLTMGIGSAALVVGRPARAALLPQVVPLHAFGNAVTWNSSMTQMAMIFGPMLGGWIANVSPRAAYVLDAACGLFMVVAMQFLHITHQPKSERAPRDLIAGLRFVYANKLVLGTMVLDLFAVLLGGATYLMPVFAKDILDVGASGMGWLRTSEALGAFTMALIQAHLPPFKRAGRAMLLSVAGFGVCTIIFGLSQNFWLSIAMLFGIGAFDSISVIVRHTLVQVLTPDSMRGRVSAINQIFIGASNELGGMESSLVAKAIGAVGSVVVGGVGTIAVVVAVGWKWPVLRKLGSLKHVAAETDEEDRV
jgi:MFS family permease